MTAIHLLDIAGGRTLAIGTKPTREEVKQVELKRALNTVNQIIGRKSIRTWAHR